MIVFQAATAQKTSVAIFKQCKETDKPYKCTDEKFAADIQNLLSGKMTDEIRISKDSVYFPVSIIFISDSKGNVDTKTLQIACDNMLLNTALKKYITGLPPFYPKNDDDTESRTVHQLFYTFVYNTELKKYIITDDTELKALKIRPDYIRFANPPLFTECLETADAYDCTKNKMYKIVGNNFNASKFMGESRVVKLMVTYVVEKDGSFTIKDITCSEKNNEMIEELKRVLKKFPTFIPGHYMNVLVRASFALPVNLNLYE